MTGYIYKIINNINQKAYVGQTIHYVSGRWNHHKSKNSNCRYLKSAIAKYGEGNFSIKTIETVEASDKASLVSKLNELESSYIKSENSLVPNGYNILPFGNSAEKHWTRKPGFLGKKWTLEQKEKYIKTKTGMKYGPKTPDQIKKSAEGCYKAVICVENSQIWPSVKSCAEYFGVKSKQISRILKGQRNRLKRKYTLTYYLPQQS